MKIGKPGRPPTRLRLPAIGLESEFSLVVDGQPARPEDIFGDPRAFIRGSLIHRTGTSYQLPSGAAIYFDTGVIEVATPLVELERGSVARAGRSLWESICFIRGELDEWDRKNGHVTRLVGFSTHYNISIEGSRGSRAQSLDALSRLLTYVLPPPVMLLALNCRSTGVGVRPRGDRVEVTADFTPSSTLMIAAGSLITGIVREVITWPSFRLDTLAQRAVPGIVGFRPIPHTSRKGWLARIDCYPENPITTDIDARVWPLTRDRSTRASLREIATGIFTAFRRPIARVADPLSLRLIHAVLSGRTASLLELPDRPREYEDVGRLCGWQPFYPDALLERSRFERVVMHALAGETLRFGGVNYTPTGMQGWSRVVFRRDDDGQQITLSLEDLLGHLQTWGRQLPTGTSSRSVSDR
jgi:hypothetical protein